MHMSTSTLTHSLKNTHALLMWCVRCATGSRWVESQCWLSLHWAPQGVFIVAKINKAAVMKCRLDPTRTQSGTPCTPATDKQKNKKEKKNNPKHRTTKKNKKRAHTHEKSDIALKSPQTFSYFHAKKEEHSRAVFSLKYTHSTSTLIMSPPKKENHLKKLGIKNPQKKPHV